MSDLNRFLCHFAPAGVLARRGTDPPEAGGERKALVQNLQSIEESFVADQTDVRLTVRVRGTLLLTRRNAVAPVVRQEEFQRGLADVLCRGRPGLHGHAFRDRRRTRLDDSSSVHLDSADAARVERREALLGAERGDLDFRTSRDVENRLPSLTGESLPVDRDRDHAATFPEMTSIAPNGQTALHRPQRTHVPSSITW